MFYFGDNMDQAPKRCGKCKSKKLKPGITDDVRTEDGHTLIRRVPKWTCKNGHENVMIHHLICEDALERWLEEPNEMPMQ